MFKPGQCAEQNWRTLRGFDYLAKVITGVTFKDGIEPINPSQMPHDRQSSNTRFDNNSNRGSDLTFEMNWPDGPSANADLTGHTVSVFEPDKRLGGLISATLTDAPNGAIRVRIEWADNLPSQTPMRFRLMTTNGAENQTTNLLAVEYS